MGQLVRTLPASHPVLVHRLAPLLHASFRPYLAVQPLRFTITSPPSGCEEDLHLQAVDHARHTPKKTARSSVPFLSFQLNPPVTSSRTNPSSTP
jgi:hypothetical protein